MSINKTSNKLAGLAIIIFGSWLTYIYVWEHDWRYVTPTDKQVKNYTISETTALNMYQLMKDTHEILVKHHINYWVEGGTLLGAVRHKGIIPFDDDLDIGIIHEEEIKLQKIFPEFTKLGYEIRHDQIYTICKKVCLDIFIFHQEDNKFIYTNMSVRKRFPNDYFYDHELFPLRKYQFGNIEVYGPQKPQGNLNRQYSEWDKYAVIQQPHNNHLSFLTNIEKKTKFLLTPALLKPAQPLGPLEDRVK
ncbi:LicD family protein [Rickettsia endosymbiont of Halotydeus destructor]|uniref:LicD family protein n=1 Tax=Rickettsia endosymbiont of Halotydeus destructor TaxID=2996754 RepID=UPI003BB04DFD